LEFLLLGPLEVRDDEAVAINVGGRQQRVLLAFLLLHANEVVSVDRLIDAIWADHPPAGAVKNVQAQISRLRRALAEDRLQTHGNGYLLLVRPGELDTDRFRRLLEDGRSRLAAGDAEAAGSTVGEALELLREQPLSDFAYDYFAQPEIDRLD